MPKMTTIMGYPYPVSAKDEVLEAIFQATSDHPVRIATLNPEFMVEAKNNIPFRTALSHMTHCTVDGFGLHTLLRLFQIPVAKRYPGADLVHDLFVAYQDGEKRFYLLGGMSGEAELAAQTLQARYPKLVVCGFESGGVLTAGEAPNTDLLHRITASRTDILLVGFGAPKQEQWIEQAHLTSRYAPVMIGVGGTFGFLGRKKRAPLLLRRMGLEWLYRGLTEKGHWHRVWRAVVMFPIYFIWQQVTSKLSVLP